MSALDQLAAAGAEIRRYRIAQERRAAVRERIMDTMATEPERRAYRALLLLRASLPDDHYTDAARDLLADAAASLADGAEERHINGDKP